MGGGGISVIRHFHQPETLLLISIPTLFPEGSLHAPTDGLVSSPILLLELKYVGNRMGLPRW